MWENLAGLLPTYIEDTLLKVLLRQNADAQDKLCWNSTPKGLFFGEVSLFSFLVGYRSTSWFLEGNLETSCASKNSILYLASPS